MSPNRREWLAGMVGLGLASRRGDDSIQSSEPTVVPPEGIGRGIRHLARSDIGGRPDSVQVMFHRDHLYVGHMFSGGVSILDVHGPSDPTPGISRVI